MKKKELKMIAQKIAKNEKIIQQSQDKEEVKKAKRAILELSGSIHSLEDMVAIDEIVQTMLEQELDK